MRVVLFVQSTIDKNLAEQIVYAVKEICGYDINFIDNNGIVFSSTDESRVGSFHEIGKEVADRREKIEVMVDDEYRGTKRGINIPIFYGNTVISIIGISGKPSEVRKYGYLAERITNLLIQEKNMQETKFDKREQIHFLINTLTQGTNLTTEYLKKLIAQWNLDINTDIRVILFHLNSDNPDVNISFFEQEIINYFSKYEIKLITYNYPNEYLALVDSNIFTEEESSFRTFADKYQGKIKIASGKSCHLLQANESLRTGRIALKSLNDYITNYINFDDLSLEILFSSLSAKKIDLFIDKVLGDSLNQNQIEILTVYFKTNMSLQETSKKLFIHKNTLQYQLNNIGKNSGYNPRKFYDALMLYLALNLLRKKNS
ncbi:hypothetical protein BAU16_09380 [Enterococcus sp. JM9B]|nr:hypothetical protein BAU16_09380 [Enterococcus sp. JM9B]